ncbi:MAG: MBL fold metallo-hydrolase [Thermosynechococcaceae cyanobacterium]
MPLHRRIMAVAIGLEILSLGGQSLAQQQDFSKTEIKTIPVTDGVYLLVGEGGNIGVSAGDDGVFMIDDQFAPLTEKIQSAIATITDKPIRFLINTHWHFDHSGGNENLGKAGVVIVAHDQVRERMSTDQFISIFTQPKTLSRGL